MRSLLLFVVALSLQVPPRTAGIDGFVLRAKVETPVPLVNARVVLEKGVEELISRTDSNGHFQFPALPPGRYRLRVAKDGFIRQEYPHAAMGGRGLPIDLVAGQQMRNVIFRMDPAPTISGVIRDDRNAPVSDVVVQALRRGYNARGNRTVTLLASARTDDHGAYRLYWLDPGEYLVAATPAPPPNLPVANLQQPGALRGRPAALAPTYFPGFSELEDAKTVGIDSSRDAAGIDFRLVRQDLLYVWGDAVSVTTGSPVVANITLTPPEDGSGVARYQTKSRVDGGYAIPGVAPGTYILSATTSNEAFATRIVVRRLELRVNLELNPGVEIPGIVAQGTGAAVDARQVRVALNEVSLSLPPPLPANAALDGTFLLKAVQPGSYSLGLLEPPEDLYLKTATQAGRDVLDQPIPVGWGRGGVRGPLEIEVGTDGARITGVVFDRDNRPFTGAEVTLIPEGSDRTRTERYRAVMSGADGTFTIRGIVPGDYRLFAWDNLEINAYLNVDYMRAYLDLGTPVHLEPRQGGSVPLRLIPLD